MRRPVRSATALRGPVVSDHPTPIRVQKLAAASELGLSAVVAAQRIGHCMRTRPARLGRVSCRASDRVSARHVATHDQSHPQCRRRRRSPGEALCRRHDGAQRRARPLPERRRAADRGRARHLPLPAAARRLPRLDRPRPRTAAPSAGCSGRASTRPRSRTRAPSAPTCSSSSSRWSAEYGASIEVAVERPGDPVPLRARPRRRASPAATSPPAELARHFPTPQLSPVGDEIADGAWDCAEGEPRPLALFDAARVDFSLQRLVHYTGSDWRARPAVDPVHQLPSLCRPVRALGPRSSCGRRRALRRLVLPAAPSSSRGDTPEQAEAAIAASTPGTLPDAGLPPDGAGRRRASRWSTSASARPTPRPSPTTWRCCAPTAG